MTQILPALFSPHSPQTSNSKEKSERCCSYLYVCVLSEPVGLCLPPPEPQPLSQTALPRQSHQLPLNFLRLWPLRRAATGYRAPTEGHIVSISILSVVNPGRSPSSLWSELTASLQKGLNACSLIIWILVNWINCWMETVLLKMTKTQGQGEQKGGLISFSVYSRAVRSHKHVCTHTHTHLRLHCLPITVSPTLCCFFTHTHWSRMWPSSEEWARGKVQITMRTVGDKN